jgi:ABC-type uncharacterized transport system YnjBCD ATPase subunit
VLVTAADVRGNNFQDHAVFTLPIADRQFGVFDFLNFYFAGLNVGYSMILAHKVRFKGWQLLPKSLIIVK